MIKEDNGNKYHPYIEDTYGDPETRPDTKVAHGYAVVDHEGDILLTTVSGTEKRTIELLDKHQNGILRETHYTIEKVRVMVVFDEEDETS